VRGISPESLITGATLESLIDALQPALADRGVNTVFAR